MLSRAVLPLTRPNVLASAVRVSALSAQRPRWYAKSGGGGGGARYKLPKSIQSESDAKTPKAANNPQSNPEAPEPSAVR